MTTSPPTSLMRSPCFGIDLGTSCSAIGFVENGVPRLLPVDDAGRELLPSVVAFPPDGKPLVGQEALNALQLMPTRTIVSSKRKIGTDHTYAITHEGRAVTPVDVAALILGRLVDAAEAALGIRPERAVITVPAWFTQSQRADTRRAGIAAGLDVVRIINEPTAAALAYAHDQNIKRLALVYDLGGGTFDVSLIHQDGPIVEVKASHGDSELGGDDVDVILRDRVLRKLDISDRAFVDAIAASPAAMLRMKVALEQAKIELSRLPTTLLSLPFLASVGGQSRHLEAELTTADLDYAAGFVLERTLASVDQVLKDAHTKPADLDALLLVGGSTLLPQVGHLLRERYGLEGSHAVHPQRAVALGAAIQAAIIDGLDTRSVLVDVAPYSLSVGVADPRPSTNRMHFITRIITPRNTPLPSRHTETFFTSSPQQTTFQLPIFQGSNPDARKNTFLGNVIFPGLQPIEGVENRPIRIEFRHDIDGLVQILVTDLLSARTIRTQLAVDGAEQSDQRRLWLERMTRNNIIFGDAETAENIDKETLAALSPSSDPSNSTSPQNNPTSDHTSGAAVAQMLQIERRDEKLPQAVALFQKLLAASDRIRLEAPDIAPELLRAASLGLRAAQPEDLDRDAALAHFNTASDLLFEAGIYL